eukprot:scaffold98879_cov30-Prasinocladus_malaysianus.AAC.2
MEERDQALARAEELLSSAEPRDSMAATVEELREAQSRLVYQEGEIARLRDEAEAGQTKLERARQVRVATNRHHTCSAHYI